MYQELIKILGNQNVYLNEPLKKHSTFRIGGNADIFVTPVNVEQISMLFDFINKKSVPFIVIGNGSNILFSDKGFRGIVVKLGSEFTELSHSEAKEGIIIKASAGTLLSRLANYALELSLTGLEFASGIPGSVGGAILMNAGAYGGEISQVLVRSEYYSFDSKEIVTKSYEKHDFGYRHSSYENDGGIILSGEFLLKKGDKNEIQSTMRELNACRAEKQPVGIPSAGSTFKRPEGYFAGKLIEDAGLKGFRIGDAMVSDKHCGFVVNVGNATCDDVINVIKYVQETVLKENNVFLETEVKIIGEL